MELPAAPPDEDQPPSFSEPATSRSRFGRRGSGSIGHARRPAFALGRAHSALGELPRVGPVAGRARIVLRMLLLADGLAVVGSFISHDLLFGGYVGPGDLPLIAVAVLLTTGVANLDGLYGLDNVKADHTTADELVAIFQTVTLVAWLMVAAVLAAGGSLHDSQGVLVQWAAALLLMIAARTTARAIIRRRHSYEQRTVIVGAGTVGQMIAEKIVRNHHMGMRLVGFIDGSPLSLSDPIADIPVLGALDQLQAAISDNAVDRVLIAFSDDALPRTLEVIRSLSRQRVQVDIVPRLFEAVGPTVRLHSLEGIPLVGLSSRPRTYVTRPAKRLFDLILATLVLIVGAPVLVILSLLVKLDSPGPVLYRSERVGEDGCRFDLCKFRTMRLEASRGARYGGSGAEQHFQELMQRPAIRDEFTRTHKLRDDPRITRIGGWLRRTSLDELPQLINVIMGDLSIVGPRPITTDEFEWFFADAPDADPSAATAVPLLRPDRLPAYWELEGVLPGITGYWQITGRSAVGYDERLRLDWAYAASCSLKLDIMILAKTIRALGGRDAF